MEHLKEKLYGLQTELEAAEYIKDNGALYNRMTIM